MDRNTEAYQMETANILKLLEILVGMGQSGAKDKLIAELTIMASRRLRVQQ